MASNAAIVIDTFCYLFSATLWFGERLRLLCLTMPQTFKKTMDYVEEIKKHTDIES